MLIGLGHGLGSSRVAGRLAAAEMPESEWNLGDILSGLAGLGLHRQADDEAQVAAGPLAAEGYSYLAWRPGTASHLLSTPNPRAEVEAAKILSAVEDSAIAAAVEAAKLTDRNLASYLIQALCERRDRTCREIFYTRYSAAAPRVQRRSGRWELCLEEPGLASGHLAPEEVVYVLEASPNPTPPLGLPTLQTRSGHDLCFDLTPILDAGPAARWPASDTLWVELRAATPQGRWRLGGRRVGICNMPEGPLVVAEEPLP